jgi:glucose-1-phosphate adenylyltransferase
VGIGQDSEVRNAIIDKNARIGRGVKLVNREGASEAAAGNYVIVGGIIVVPKNAIIPDGTVI